MAKNRTTHAYPGDPARGEARILCVDEHSPADDAGFTAGCVITAVNGHPLRDITDWSWYSDGHEIELSYIDTDGDSGTAELFREDGEAWGMTFDGAVFDGVRTCKNNCMFCFMRQLPDGARDSLSLRDDDWRLSFLQGNFTTLTNLTDEDADTIIERGISPLRVSLHCITPELRKKVIGPHQQRGVDMLKKIDEAGITTYLQIVLMPDVNDGEELKRTLEWAYNLKNVEHIGIVPVGFTKHQTKFKEGFGSVEKARPVVETIRPFQNRAFKERGGPWVYVSDEFYRSAYPNDLLDHLPPSKWYGTFDMFEDGIGIIRSFIDDWETCSEDQFQSCANTISQRQTHVHFVLGYATREYFTALINSSPLKGLVIPLYVKNDYFGGNVDVTGLLCGCDVAQAMKGISAHDYVVLPDVMFNPDGITLDDMTVDDIRDTAGIPATVVSCNASEFLTQLEDIVRG